MSRKLLQVGLGVLFVVLSSNGVHAQSVKGRISDAATGAPVPRVEVALLNAEQEPAALGVSDSAGWFNLRVGSGGIYQLEVVGPGYSTLKLDSILVDQSEEVVVEVRLGPLPFQLDPIQVVTRRMVSGPLRDFYWRAEQNSKTGRGIVVDRAELEQFAGHPSRRVLAQQVFVREAIRGGPARILVKRRLVKFGGDDYCEPDFFVDGNRVDALAVLSIPATDLEGLEVYRGVSQVPTQFQRSKNSVECGVILAWTRRE